MSDVDVRIRRAEGLDDYLACVALQKEVWGYTEADDVAAQPMLMIGNRCGGSVLVALAGSRYIGFAFALPGWKPDKKLFWWSHMTAVVQDFQKRGVGLALKRRQREEALAEGIDLIEWTFDPLQAMNAYFNICKLGVLIREYEENVYGYTSSVLHRGLPTDRFVAEWHLKSDRVTELLKGGSPKPSRNDEILLGIPADVNALKASNLAEAKAWQGRLRAACQNYFHSGYVITGFIKSQAQYILEKGGGG